LQQFAPIPVGSSKHGFARLMSVIGFFATAHFLVRSATTLNRVALDTPRPCGSDLISWREPYGMRMVRALPQVIPQNSDLEFAQEVQNGGR
jgi:hypothetical protein